MLIGDSAFPPQTYPTTYGGKPVVGWCVYIPGGDAYHGWSQAEIDHLKAQAWCRYLLPVFVRSHPQGTAQAAADAAAVAAWIHAQGQPSGTLVMMDYETAIDSVYETTFDRALREATGDLEVLYGSRSTVIRNTAPSGGYDEADWTGQAPGSLASAGQQFYSCDTYDLNEFRDTAPLWDIRPATPPHAPAQRPTVQRGSTGYWVGICQRSLMLAGRDPHGVDDKFGGDTFAAVESFQSAVHIGRDGVVGKDTWGHLESRTLAVQKALAAHGYGKGGQDCTAGPETAAEVLAFQHAKGLLPDGICGRHTSAALGIAPV